MFLLLLLHRKAYYAAVPLTVNAADNTLKYHYCIPQNGIILETAEGATNTRLNTS